MTRLFDTSAWIEIFVESALGRRLATKLPDAAECIVPTLVQLELAKWFRRERSEEMADYVIAYTMTCEVLPLDTQLALRAADLCRLHRLTTADSVVYASALESNADLITCDAHFKGLANVMYFGKPG